LWLLGGFYVAQYGVGLAIVAGIYTGLWSESIDTPLFGAIASAIIYVCMLIIVIGVPWRLFGDVVTRGDVGMGRLPHIRDAGLTLVAFVVYMVASVMFIQFAALIVPGFNVDQEQDIIFTQLTASSDYIVAFITLVIVAPLAEEVLFRGYLYSKMRRVASVWVSTIAISLLFGYVHGQWNVGVDVFALSLVACWLREYTGTLWAGLFLHMLKNGLAFYLLFINPQLLGTIL
jgi:membrane protease YdiL (CAAX protease family)